MVWSEIAAQESPPPTITNKDPLAFHRLLADELAKLDPGESKGNEVPSESTSDTDTHRLAFHDTAPAVIGHNESYQAQLMHGHDYWRARSDKHFIMDLAGAQGLLVGDANGDHLDDVYVLQPGGLPNRLFIHQEDGTALDQSSEAKLDILDGGHHGLFVDLDNDGDQDLIVAVDWQLLIIDNAGEGQFQPGTMLWSKGRISSVSAADFDNDGDLDLYACARDASTEVWAEEGALTHGIPTPYFDANNGGRNTLWRNSSQKKEATTLWQFTDVTEEVGLDHNNRRFSSAAAWEDYDGDGDQDLYVVNDFGRNNLYRNANGPEAGSRVFTDVAAKAGVEDIGPGMSAAWGDINGDDWMDLYVANRYSAAATRIVDQESFLPKGSDKMRAQARRFARGNSVYLNNGDGTFRDHTKELGANSAGWAWSSNFIDLNNDGYEDLVVANGMITTSNTTDVSSFAWRRVASQSPESLEDLGSVFTYRKAWRALNTLLEEGRSYAGSQRNRAFLRGGDGKFSDISAACGLDLMDDGRAIAAVDWDHDGKQDFWISNRNAPRVRFMHNRSETAHHFVALRLQGNQCNRDAIGARVTIQIGKRKLIRSLQAGKGYLGQSTKWLHFGLGDATSIDTLEVRWPGGERELISVRDLSVDRFYFIVQDAGTPRQWTPPKIQSKPPAENRKPATDPEQPPNRTRIAFLSRLPLPEVKYDTFDGQRRSLVTTDRKPSLIHLWASWHQPCLTGLKELSKATGLREHEQGLEIIALSVDQFVQPAAAARKSPDEIAKTLEELGWPYASGMATEELRLVLEVVGRALIARYEPFPVTTSLLIDGKGKVAVIYKGSVSVEQLRKDVAVLDARWNKISRAAVHFPGQWVRGPWPSDPSLVVKNFVATTRADLAEKYLKRFKAATTDDQNLADGYYLLADFHRGNNNFGKAILLYEKALEIDKRRTRVHLDLGMVYLGMGQNQRAARHLRKAAENYPEDEMVRGWLESAK
jgi:hypothetical protein